MHIETSLQYVARRSELAHRIVALLMVFDEQNG
jgi:hypothetical protein